VQLCEIVIGKQPLSNHQLSLAVEAACQLVALDLQVGNRVQKFGCQSARLLVASRPSWICYFAPMFVAAILGGLTEQHVSRGIQLLGKEVRPTNVWVQALHQAVIGRPDFLFGRLSC